MNNAIPYNLDDSTWIEMHRKYILTLSLDLYSLDFDGNRLIHKTRLFNITRPYDVTIKQIEILTLNE